MGQKYGYCRVSTPNQSIERQVRNIKEKYPDAVIVREVYTGTKFQGRKELEAILKNIKAGDMIIFDSVSRMSRSAEEGFELYQELYKTGIELVFLKEPYINTDVYRSSQNRGIDKTGNRIADIYIEATNTVLMMLAEDQIRIAFEQSEKEVLDLRQRTKEGMVTAKLSGKQIGAIKGKKLVTKKSIEAKQLIQKYSRDFDGSLNDKECIKLLSISKGSFYKYKKELKNSPSAQLF